VSGASVLFINFIFVILGSIKKDFLIEQLVQLKNLVIDFNRHPDNHYYYYYK